MTDYETIFAEGHEKSLRGSSGNSGAFAKANSDALAAVVAAAKAEALLSAADDALTNHPSWNGAGQAVRNRLLYFAENPAELPTPTDEKGGGNVGSR